MLPLVSFSSCPSLNSLFCTQNHMDSHNMLNWALDIENCEVCHSGHPYDANTFSVQVAAADASGWLRNKDTKFKHEKCRLHLDRWTSTKLSDSFGKEIVMHWSHGFSWRIMRLQGPAVPLSPLFFGRSQQYELRGKQRSHECNIRRIRLSRFCCTKSRGQNYT